VREAVVQDRDDVAEDIVGVAATVEHALDRLEGAAEGVRLSIHAT
jgi:hypothetical protein